MTDQEIIAAPFDYKLLDIPTRVFVEARASSIHALLRKTAHNIIEIGTHLNDVKVRLDHGQFGDWIEAEFHWTQRTADRYMAVAVKFDTMSNLEQFSPTALYLMAAPSTPEEVVEAMQQKAADGERVTPAAVKQAIAATKPALTAPAAEADARTRQVIIDALQGGKQHRNILERICHDAEIGPGYFGLTLHELLKNGAVERDGDMYRLLVPESPNADYCTQIVALLREQEHPMRASDIIDDLHLDYSAGWHALSLLMAEKPPRIQAVKGLGGRPDGFTIRENVPAPVASEARESAQAAPEHADAPPLLAVTPDPEREEVTRFIDLIDPVTAQVTQVYATPAKRPQRTINLADGSIVQIAPRDAGYICHILAGKDRFTGWGETHRQALTAARKEQRTAPPPPATPAETRDALNRAQLSRMFWEASSVLLRALRETAAAAALLADVPSLDRWTDGGEHAQAQARIADLLDLYAVVQPDDPLHPIQRAHAHLRALAGTPCAEKELEDNIPFPATQAVAV